MRIKIEFFPCAKAACRFHKKINLEQESNLGSLFITPENVPICMMCKHFEKIDMFKEKKET